MPKTYLVRLTEGQIDTILLALHNTYQDGRHFPDDPGPRHADQVLQKFRKALQHKQATGTASDSSLNRAYGNDPDGPRKGAQEWEG